MSEPSGGRLIFKGNGWARDFHLVTKKTGYTNLGSGQTNIKNIVARWHAESDRFHVVFGDGTRRIYARQWRTKDKENDSDYSAYYRDYHLIHVMLPSGNHVIYKYNDAYEIKSIHTLSHDYAQKLNWIHFEQKSPGAFAKHPSLHITTSDKQEYIYYFKRLKGHGKKGVWAVSGIRRPGLAYMRFVYSEPNARHKRRVIRTETDDGSFIAAKYYRPSRNKVGDQTVELKNKERRKLFTNRVRMLQAPVGPHGEKAITHSFFYHKDKKQLSTTVKDAYGNITRYHYNNQNRLTKIEKCDAHWNRFQIEKFIWGSGKEEGYLKTRTLFDEEETPAFCREYGYDQRGNITSETVYGKFRQNSGDIKLDHKGYPTHTSCDQLTKYYSYSDDGFNLKTSESDYDGNYTYYKYVKGTNLLSAKFICDKKTITTREFYSYDSNAILIEKIVDDGVSENKENLHKVTQRHITKIKPRTICPHFGKPQVVQEYYLDLATRSSVLLSKTVNKFSSKGFVIEKKVYGADKKLQATSHYDYDDIGRLVMQKDPLGRVETYTYDTSGYLETKTNPQSTTTYLYDRLGHLVQESEHLPDRPALTKYHLYDLLGRKIVDIDPQNNETHYKYGPLSRIIKITYPDIYDQYGNKITPKKHFEYKKLGTIKIETDENGYKTTTHYNAEGKVFEVHLPDDTHRYCCYDKKGNLTQEIAPNGTVQKRCYDAFNRMIESKMVKEDVTLSKKTCAYNSFHQIQEISPTGEVIGFSYDAAGRKKSTTINGVEITRYNYDSLSRLSTEQVAYTKSLSYDACNRVTDEKIVDKEGTLHRYKRFIYDAQGRWIDEIVPVMDGTATTRTEYLIGQIPTKRTDALDNSWHYHYDYFYTNGHKQRVFKKSTVDPRGVVQEEIFDTRGSLSAVVIHSSSGELLAKKELFYDAATNLTCTLEHAIVDGQITKTIKTLFFYGPNNRLEKIVEDADTPTSKTTHYLYNSFGQNECVLHADNTKLYTLYDKKGRVEHFFAEDNSLSYSYEYDESDKIRFVTNNQTQQKTHRNYNRRGELSSETLESGLILKYSYDNWGRTTNITLPDNSEISYSYSPVHIESVTRKSCDKHPLWSHSITERDLSGKPRCIKLPHQAGSLQAEHDLLLRTTVLKHPFFTQKLTQFDSVGNLCQTQTKDPLGTIESQYDYTLLSQLTKEQSHILHDYSYNSLHDRLSLDAKPYEVNNLHSVLLGNDKTYTYDLRGNRLTDGALQYSYDALDRLVKIEFQDKSFITYSYDAFNRRIEKVSHDAHGHEIDRERYLYLLQNEIGSVDATNTITSLRILGEGVGAEIGASVGMELQGALYIPLHDARGNITCLVSQEGKVAESYRYDAFGNELIYDSNQKLVSNSIVNNPWRFSSKRTDDETSLVYFGRRYYDPSLGSWLTMDPLGLKAGPNLYAYVLNNPLTHCDFYGLLVKGVNANKLNLPSNNPNDPQTRDALKSAGFEFRYDQPRVGREPRIISISLGRERLPGASIFYINGTNTPLGNALEQLEYLSDRFQEYEVELCYNCHINLAIDLFRCHMERSEGMPSMTQYDFRECCNAVLNPVSEENTNYVMAYGFSEGAIILRNALASMPREQTDKTLARTVCPGAIIQKGAALDVKNYMNRNPLRDPVPWSNVGGIGKSVLKNPSLSHIEFCKSHNDADFFDHALKSPTYKDPEEQQFSQDVAKYLENK